MTLKNALVSAAGNAAADRLYIEDVFSTYLYTGTGSTQTITNNIDFAGEGGMLWIKNRSSASSHCIVDTVRGATTVYNELNSASTAAQNTGATFGVTALGSSGFSLSGARADNNGSGSNYASWTFRKAEKFFDVVTYTGNGAARTIPHNLGSVPGCIIVKVVTSPSIGSSDWVVYHRSTGNSKWLALNLTDAEAAGTFWNNTDPTDTHFTLGINQDVNKGDGTTYVAYLFAHDAGGFGEDGEQNIISCGGITTNGSANQTVTLGYEPQWILIKKATGVGGWILVDTMRGIPSGQNENYLLANASSAEASSINAVELTPTGFITQSTLTNVAATWIYIAIRRGPMKVPESGTEVYNPLTRVGTGTDVTITANITPVDLVISKATGGVRNVSWWDRLRGRGNQIYSNSSAAEIYRATSLTGFDVQNGYKAGSDGDNLVINSSGESYVNWSFRRAPGFFDVVCYTGTGVARTVSHNLGVAPEMMIVKKRSASGEWVVYAAPIGNDRYLILNATNSQSSVYSGTWNSTTPTSTVFSLGTDIDVNTSGSTYVAYLFASCPGVSKVGTYTGTGTGTTNQIDCGFSGGARFILIKRTDDAGSWYVWDSARGIVAGNDPYLLLNSTNAEVTNTDYIDPYSAGFELSSTAPVAINASGGSYIFLAIA